MAGIRSYNVVGFDKFSWIIFDITVNNPLPLVGFIATLLVMLVAMATFRSPAVALMPDVTIKPLRSKANAIINLTGTAGGIIVLVLGMIFATSKDHYMQYTGYVFAVVCVMLVGFIILDYEQASIQQLGNRCQRIVGSSCRYLLYVGQWL